MRGRSVSSPGGLDIAGPYSEPFRPRPGPLPGEHPGGAPRALYRWDTGRITREQYDAVPQWLRSE
jgi:hypothetical protein